MCSVVTMENELEYRKNQPYFFGKLRYRNSIGETIFVELLYPISSEPQKMSIEVLIGEFNPVTGYGEFENLAFSKLLAHFCISVASEF